MAAEFVPFSQSRNAKPGADGKIWRSLNWRIAISRNGRPVLENVDYSQGETHCPAYRSKNAEYGKIPYGRGMSIPRDAAIALECETGKVANPPRFTSKPYPTSRAIPAPAFADVLASLALDASVLDYSGFDQWGPDCGYDPDSRAGEAIYRVCLSHALALRAAIGDAGLEALREAAQDY